MSAYAYDQDNWLVSTHRSLEAWVRDQLTAVPALGTDVQVEMSFPDTSQWRINMPLDKILIHFEQDDESDPVLGFGQPGVEVLNTTDPNNPTWQLQEAARHDLNFDVGVWVSAEMGGATKRMETVQALKNLFTSVQGRRQFNLDTEGLNIVSFEGGNNIIDRINDVPVWRAMGMTLIVRVFSRHLPSDPPLVVPTDALQDESLSIIGGDGQLEPI